MTYARVLRYFLVVAFPDETDVLEHIFLSAGNGMAWRDGGIAPPGDPVLDGTDATAIEDALGYLHSRMESIIDRQMSLEDDPNWDDESRARETRILDKMAAPITRSIELLECGDVELYLEIKRTRADELAAWWAECVDDDPLPIARGSLITSIPDDVRLDWLDAATRCLEWARGQVLTETGQEVLTEATERVARIRMAR